MKDHRIGIFLRLFRWLTGLSLLLCGGCLIAACLGLYFSGGGYSRQAVAAAFSPIALPVLLCPALVVIGLILGALFPEAAKKPVGGRETRMTWARLAARKDRSAAPETAALLERSRRARILCRAVQAVVIAVQAAVFLVYALNGSHFDDTDINGSVIALTLRLLPLLAGCFIACWIMDRACSGLLRREIDLLKTLPNGPPPAARPEKRGRNALRLSVVLLGAVLLVAGICSGGVADVIAKAVNICTECIGLG